MNTTNIKKDKKWNYVVISDNTAETFQKFNEIYDKNREAARYFVINNKLISSRLIVFINKNVHIIVHEYISYGVSISLKRYKSTKTVEKVYLDTSNGSISRNIKGKFLPCKSSDISHSVYEYVISQIKWIDFVFKLQLPLTFTTIVTKKLYSEKKLLSWFWGSNYSTARKLNKIFKQNNDVFLIRKNLKNIRNIDNINPEFFIYKTVRTQFLSALFLAIKTMKVINAAWSYKRLVLETKKMNRQILDTLYENYDEPIDINENFIPFLNKIKSYGYYIPKTTKEISKICNDANKVQQSIQQMINGNLIIKKNDTILTLSYGPRWHSSTPKTEFAVYESYSMNINSVVSEDTEEFIKYLNKHQDIILKTEERKNKINKIKEKVKEEETEEFDFYDPF